MDIDKEKIAQEILKRSQQNKISCRQCFDIAKEFNVAIRVIGELCNEKDVRIRACQLGCFK